MRKNKKSAASTDITIDNNLLEYIQPSGGITFKEAKDIFCGDGYIRALRIYALPKVLDDFWLDNMFNLEDSIVTMDIHTKNIGEVKKNINKSLSEEFAREHTATNYMQVYDARMRQDELKEMLHELTTMGEVVKMADFRIFVKGRNRIELDAKCESIMETLESDSYLSTCLLNESKSEWTSLFENYTKSHAKPFYMKGHPLLTDQIAFGYPFNYSELIDEFGTLIGFTPIGGVVLFDEFTKTKQRKHYNSLVCGDMGSGKSTFLKKRFKANAAAGNFLRVFDVTGEFEPLTREFGGKIIKCSGADGMLNPLEILKSGDDDFASYARHIAKVSTFFRCMMPSISDEIIINLEGLLRDFYEERELTPKENRTITGLRAKDYPTFSDLLSFCERELDKYKASEGGTAVETELLKMRAKNLAGIIDIVSNIVKNYGKMFDGHTSVDNIVDEKIVTFDISDIKDLGNVFAAQMFNMVSLCWDNAVNNGQIMKQLWESEKLDIEDITKFLILIDESHRWVNTNMPMILDLLIVYLREARKWFAGITFASQSVRDFMPQGENNPYVDTIRTLFELTQYKFMFRQDSSTLELLNKIFNNELTFSQIAQIPFLGRGETILSMSGYRSLRFTVWLSKDYEDKLFAGGR